LLRRAARFTRKHEGAKLTNMKATSREPEIVTRNGKPVSVIISIKEYEELLERAEDAEDVRWLKRARRKKLHSDASEMKAVVIGTGGM